MLNLLPFLFLLINNADKLEAFAVEGKNLLDEIAPGLLPLIASHVSQPTKFSVNWLQAALNKAMNAGLDVDGDYGDATHAAVRAYQAARGLEVDGWAGTLTCAKLFSEVGGNP